MQWTWSKAGGYWSMTAAAIEIIWTQNPTELTSSIETKSMLAVTRISEGHGARMAESLKFLVVMGLGIFILGGLGEMILGYYLLTTMLLEIIGNQQAEEVLEKMMNYCWWKKSCTSWYGKYPIIYMVLYIPGGAGFLPSTVGTGPGSGIKAGRGVRQLSMPSVLWNRIAF